MRPDAGSARVLGLDVVRDFWAIRTRVGYMPGRFSLYPDLSVEENLGFFASVFGTTVEKGADADRADLQADRAVHRSARRCALGRDEAEARAVLRAGAHAGASPARRADDRRRRRVAARVLGSARDAARRGLTIVVSTPYMDEATRCDRVALIQRGRILEIADPRRIGERFDRPLLAVRAAERHAPARGAARASRRRLGLPVRRRRALHRRSRRTATRRRSPRRCARISPRAASRDAEVEVVPPASRTSSWR